MRAFLAFFASDRGCFATLTRGSFEIGSREGLRVRAKARDFFIFLNKGLRRLLSVLLVLLLHIGRLKSLNLLALAGGLLPESLGLIFLVGCVFHLAESLHVFLALELLEELLVTHKDRVGVTYRRNSKDEYRSACSVTYSFSSSVWAAVSLMGSSRGAPLA